MALDEKDFFQWFGNEINRFRDLERQTSGYVAAMFVFVAAWASDSTRNNLILHHRLVASVFPILSMLACFVMEWHNHKRLNDYRAQREALVEGGTIEGARKQRGKLIASRVDGVYFIGFQVFNVLTPLIAMWAIWKAGT